MRTKKDKPAPETTTDKRDCLPLSGLWGLAVAFVVASIAYSTAVIYLGTDDLAARLMVLPQVAFAAWVVLFKFSK